MPLGGSYYIGQRSIAYRSSFLKYTQRYLMSGPRA